VNRHVLNRECVASPRHLQVMFYKNPMKYITTMHDIKIMCKKLRWGEMGNT